MPEGPELHLASRFINHACKSRTFGGKVLKSEVSRQLEIEWNCPIYRISSKSRGKELMLTLMEDVQEESKCSVQQTCHILFHFGMSGVFKLTGVDDIPKHSHLRFYTSNEEPQKVLSFVDVRRFGGWQETSKWSTDRGPDPVLEYQHFRENILCHLDDPAFKKPVCEVLLNQKYFNGIGNYLRAEILYRADVKPFEEARSVFEHLPISTDVKVKTEIQDILRLCHDVPEEVIKLDVMSSYDPSATREDIKPFLNWLQCYDNPTMKKMRDHNKRTIWFSGEPGPLAPKKSSDDGPKKNRKKRNSKEKSSPSLKPDKDKDNVAVKIMKDEHSSPKKATRGVKTVTKTEKKKNEKETFAETTSKRNTRSRVREKNLLI